MQRLGVKEFCVVMFLEAVQNVPLIGGFIAAYSFWQQSWLLVAVSILTGSTLSALSMISTEGRIFDGHRESARAIVANVAIFSVLMFAFMAYVQASWSSYWTDLIGGLVGGASLGMGQDLAAKERIGVVRILALGISCLVSLFVIRFAITAWHPLVSFAVVTTWFTLAMGGYKLWRRRVPLPR